MHLNREELGSSRKAKVENRFVLVIFPSRKADKQQVVSDAVCVSDRDEERRYSLSKGGTTILRSKI